MELTAWTLTRLYLGDYFRTYPETVEDEVRAALSAPEGLHSGSDQHIPRLASSFKYWFHGARWKLSVCALARRCTSLCERIRVDVTNLAIANLILVGGLSRRVRANPNPVGDLATLCGCMDEKVGPVSHRWASAFSPLGSDCQAT